jgi:hypothetical protein
MIEYGARCGRVMRTDRQKRIIAAWRTYAARHLWTAEVNVIPTSRRARD